MKGVAFQGYQKTFTTGAVPARAASRPGFERVSLPSAQGKEFYGLTMGPDGKLYAGTSDGLILRFAVNADGTLGPGRRSTRSAGPTAAPALSSGWHSTPPQPRTI